MLPYIAHNYKTEIHRSIKKTPYEVMFSIKSNMIIQCSNGGNTLKVEVVIILKMILIEML